MKLYADTAGRRARQLVGDLVVALWVLVWVWLGTVVHDVTAALAAPAALLEDAGVAMADGLQEAAGTAAGVPIVGDELRAPIDRAGEAAASVAQVGRDQREAVLDLALLLGVMIAAVPAVLLLLLWLPRRIAFARQAAAAQRFIDADADLDLFAVRALARQPMHVLARISDDPAGAWRRGDAPVVRALATAELRACGLRPPSQPDGR